MDKVRKPVISKITNPYVTLNVYQSIRIGSLSFYDTPNWVSIPMISGNIELKKSILIMDQI